ncbi:MAG TPA: PLP-dependent aminotransferase family protein [Bacillota bacterium]|nr:PLP-dependent aminotransferase family protein [Bacillota bacterium]
MAENGKENQEKFVHLAWKPDKTSEVPLYRQIVDYVSSQVSRGDWTIGSKLPSQREMADIFEVNRSTIVSAMEELMSYGMIEASYGGGTRIASNTWSLLMSAPPDWNRYIASGTFQSNLQTIQTINKLEFDERYVRLGTGEISPELFPEAMMKDVLHALPDRIPSLNYLGPLGLPELQQSLCKRLKKRGIDVKPSNILITSGSLQALQLISVCMMKPGATVFTEAPSYLKSLQVFPSAGMEFSGVPMDQSGIMYWKIEKILNGSLLYTIPTHHNPTGTIMTQERRKEVYDFCSVHRLPIIEDDAYGELWFEEEQPPFPMKSLDKNGMILYTGTISKTLSPGLRTGWLVGPESVVERLGDVKMQMDYGTSSLSQWALTEILEGGAYDEYLDALRPKLKKRRDIALAALEKHFSDIAEWNRPTGGFYIWVRIRKNIPSGKLFQEALRKNILLNPGSIYDYKENKCLRLSYAYAAEEDLEKGIRMLGKIIKG